MLFSLMCYFCMQLKCMYELIFRLRIDEFIKYYSFYPAIYLEEKKGVVSPF